MSDNKSSAVVQGIRQLFADTYALYLKTQNYHWNVTGPHFAPLHTMFESQYRELAEALDGLAERLRILGVKAPGTFEEIQSLASIKSGSADHTAQQMLSDLLAGHTLIIQRVSEVMRTAVDAADDGTVGLLSERLGSHEKTAWLLRSSLS